MRAAYDNRLSVSRQAQSVLYRVAGSIFQINPCVIARLQALLLGEANGLCVFFNGSRGVADVDRLYCHRICKKRTAFDSANLIEDSVLKPPKDQEA